MPKKRPQKPTTPAVLADILFPRHRQHSRWQEDHRRLSDTLEQLRSQQDERALVLVGAMLVEHELGAFLEAALPSFAYEYADKKRDLTLSIRIALARATHFIPPAFLDAADAIRGIRNDFAHELTVTQLTSSHADTLRHHCEQVSVAAGLHVAPTVTKPRAIFHHTILIVVLNLNSCAELASNLRSFLETLEFRTAFAVYLDGLYGEADPGPVASP